MGNMDEIHRILPQDLSLIFNKIHFRLDTLLIFGSLHSNGYIFPFLLCLLLLFLSQLFVRPPQTAILLFSFLFLGDGLEYCLLYNVTNLSP